jgi:uncharacterized protein YcbX
VQVCRIEIFPIKSLDGVTVEEAGVTPGGILENDRIYAIMDEEGKFMNGKRTARVHQLRSAFDPKFAEVRLWENGGSPTQFALSDLPPINKWLSDFFSLAVSLHRNPEKGFPDDTIAFGPTIASLESLQAIQQWYPGVALESVRRRFRANLEITGGAPFCEDHLFGAPDTLKPFQVGPVKFLGHNPCQRCVVPTRDPDSGEGIAGFQKTFMQMRKDKLPEWSDARRFNHFYRFAINTSIPPTEAGKHLRLGDDIILA